MPEIASNQSQNRRSVRNIIIHRPMQREFTIITIAIMMASALFVNFLIQHTIQEIISDNLAGFGRIGAYNLLSDASFELIARVTLVMFVTILTVGLFGVFFLHRVAGPVYRFHQLFLRLNRNEIPSDVYLRKKDFFKEVAFELNTLFKLLRERKEAINQVGSILSSISDRAEPPEVRKKIQDIRVIIQAAHDKSSE